MDSSIFKKKFEDLGPISGAEIRWAITVVGMVWSMLAGWMSTAVAATTFAIISMFPLIGSVNTTNYFKNAPFGTMLQMCFNGLIAVLFSNYGLDNWFAGFVVPWLSKLSPMMMMFVCCFGIKVMMALFPNANAATITVCITIFTPVVISLGLNPVTILAPGILTAGQENILGVQMNMFITYKYGYWEMSDPIAPGIVTNIVWALIATVLVYFIHPFAGLTMFL